MNLFDKYLCKAMDAYPYDLEGTIESLDYALSYNSENAAALCLYGKVYAEQMKDFKTAKSYFRQALAADMGLIEIYPSFIQLLIDFEENTEAENLIVFALTVKGINKPEIISKLVLLKEKLREYKDAIKWIKELKMTVLDNEYKNFISETEKRIKEKKEMLKK